MQRVITGSMVVLIAMCLAARADTITLRNGTSVDGKYAGGTATTVSVETAQGVLALQTTDVLTITFAGGASAPAAAAPAAAVVAPAPAAAAPVAVTVPA